MFKKLFVSVFVVAVALFSLNAQAVTEADKQNPYTLVKAVSEQTFARFEQDKAQIKADINHLKLIIREELLPNIDAKYSAYKVLGRHLKSTTKEQREQFVDAFTEYMVMTYAQAFTEYTDQKVEFEPERAIKGKTVSVGVRIVEQGRPPIKISFKVRKLKNNNWKAFDMVAEGVSLIASKQSEIGALVKQQGIDGVVQTLYKKSQTKLKAKD